MRTRTGMYILDADHTPVPCDDLDTWTEALAQHERAVVEFTRRVTP